MLSSLGGYHASIQAMKNTDITYLKIKPYYIYAIQTRDFSKNSIREAGISDDANAINITIEKKMNSIHY